MLEFLGQALTLSPLSKTVLTVVLHLTEDDDTVFEDSHLCKTWECKIAYTSQKPFKNLIIIAQGRKMHELLANSIWRCVILDKYVDFEGLYVTLNPSYDPDDDASVLNKKFALLEWDSIRSKCVVLTESEWMCLYDIWADAVLHFYPHRKIELALYRELIVNMFQATAFPFLAIKYDCDSWEHYSC